MGALTVHFVVLLIALQTPAEPPKEKDPELPSQEQPEAEDQDMDDSFAEDERSTREAAGLQHTMVCHCRARLCRADERRYGYCTVDNTHHNRCCR